MKKPTEHGNIVTSLILGVSSVALSVVLRRDFYSVIFWVPIWMGLFIYDVPFGQVRKSNIDVLWMTLILLFSALSIYVNFLMVIPYLIFFAAYSMRIYLIALRMNYVGTVLGILAYIVLFGLTIDLGGYRGILLMVSLFVYMLGSEFTVRAKVARRRILLLYDIIPSFFLILNPAFAVLSLSIARIPVAIKAKTLKPVGIAESVMLFVAVLVLSLFYVVGL